MAVLLLTGLTIRWIPLGIQDFHYDEAFHVTAAKSLVINPLDEHGPGAIAARVRYIAVFVLNSAVDTLSLGLLSHAPGLVGIMAIMFIDYAG